MARVATAVLLAAVCVGLILPTRAAAQPAGTSTAAIEGRVVDTTGAPLPSVTVVASSPALIGTRQALTDPGGFYRFPALPPGLYTLQFMHEGFASTTRQGLRVTVGFTGTVDAVLDVAAQDTVVVQPDQTVVDRHATSISTSFDADVLGSLPTSRSMSALLSATPAVYVTQTEVGGGLAGGAYGAYGTFGPNRPMVEGISVAGIGNTFALDYGSFEEVSVGTAAHSSEWPIPGVHTKFISKSGGNDYRGSLYADYENHDWQAFNIDSDQIAHGAQGGIGLPPREANRATGYRDFNADVGGHVRRDRLWWYSSFRKQEVTARQPNFPVEPVRTDLTNYSAKLTYQVTRDHKIAAFAQAGRKHQPTRLDPSTLLSGVNATSAINESESSTSNHHARGTIWKVEWNAVIKNTLFFETRAGQFGTRQADRSNGGGPRFEDTQTLLVSGGNRKWQRDLLRNQWFGSLSYFKDRWLGSHQLRVGSEVLQSIETETWWTAYAGDVLHVLRDGQPREVFLTETPSMSEAGSWIVGAYINDSWRPNSRLTVNAGVLFDRYRLFLPEQRHPAFSLEAEVFPAVNNLRTWNVWVPRIGVAYDLSGDGRTVAKFSYGQNVFPPGTDLAANANPNSSLWWRRYPWVDANGDGRWEPGEEDRSRLQGSRGGKALESLDPSLELSFLREVTTSLERQLPGKIAVRTGIVWRGERQHFMRQNINQPFEAFSVPVLVPDPGPDGREGTPDDQVPILLRELRPDLLGLPPVNVIRSVPDSDSDHWTWEIAASKRSNWRWSFATGFARTWSRDQASLLFTQPLRQNTYPLTPNDLSATASSGRYEFTVWSAKIHGTYNAPWGLRVTPLLRHQSGAPFGRTLTVALNYASSLRVLTEPIGTRRTDNITILDIRLEKEIRLPRVRRVAVFLDGFNLLNDNPVQTANWTSGSAFLQPLTIVSPRIARIGAMMDW